MNGQPIDATKPFILVHCFTNQRLAGTGTSLPTEFGSEKAVCAHTFVYTNKVNKLMRETRGAPTAGLISRSETEENMWCFVYA